ncbi:MAG: hypothetical protein ABSA41_22770 [Terriglobia bacterium]
MRRNNKSYWSTTTASFTLAALLCLSLIWASRSYGIPAFSRKYQTSCATCHSDFPELNDFGLAFKKNGFKFPKDDEFFVKEPPVMLGAKAQKEAFPKAIYPGEIPGTIPISFRYSGFASYNSKQPLALGYLPRTDLFTPNTFTILSAGSFGQNIAWWIDDDISTGGSGADGGLGDGYIKVNDLGHYIGLPKDTLNLRFGQFELDLPFTQARTINPSDYDIYDEAAMAATGMGTTSNPFVFSAPQRGIEIGGYPNDGNLWWSVAVINGNNDNPAVRNSKDVFVNVWKQFNLERDPQVRNAVQGAGPTGPRDHTSLRVGTFYYYGRNALNVGGTLFPNLPTIHDPFYRIGGDFRFKYRQFELYGLGMFGRDANQLVTGENSDVLMAGPPVNFSGGFAEGEYWFYPWLIGIMRYDIVNSPVDFQSGLSQNFTRNRFSPGVQLLLRANIKALFEYQRRWEVPIPGASQYFRPNGFVTGVDFVF